MADRLTLPSVQVVIVHYRTADLLIECLRSLAEQVPGYPGRASVTVVDNQSQDGSVQRIAQAIASEGWSGWATLVESPVNGGFAYGNNHAIRPALTGQNPPDLFWLLNPDTKAYPGAMAALARFLAAHPKAGLAGGSLEERPGELWPYAFRFPTLLSELDGGLALGVASRLLSRWSILRPMGDQPACVDWVSGASLMVKREVFEAIGLMDDNYFLYYEETDFCLQAQRAGWECWYVPESRVFHVAGASTGLVDKPPEPRRLPRYWFESRRRFFVKNRSRAYAMATDMVWIGAYLLRRARYLVQGKRDAYQPPQLLGDFVRNSSLVTSRIAVNPAANSASR